MIPLREFPFERETLVVAHRGASGLAPENTMAAFALAVRRGAGMIELDVQRTADGVLVVIHDTTLRRTTNGRGRVAQRTFADLSALDAGSWFAPRFAHERIPRLLDVLKFLHGKAYVNIELKPSAARAGIAPALVACVHAAHMQKHVLVSSFHHATVRRVKELDSSIATAIILHPALPPRTPITPFARRAHADAIVCAVRQVTRRRVEEAHAHGLIVGAYTVNSPRTLQRMLHAGVRVVVTNIPGEL